MAFILSAPGCQHQIQSNPTCIGESLIASSSSMRDLEVIIDADVTMRGHLAITVHIQVYALLRFAKFGVFGAHYRMTLF
jgi:hypothetical protein